MNLFHLLGMNGKPGFIVGISDTGVTDAVVDPADAEVGYRLGTDGVIYRRNDDGGAWSATGSWLTPSDSDVADLYECQATLNSGTLTTGTTGSWLALTSDREWTKRLTSVGNETADFTLEIRLIGTSTTLTSATITFVVDVSV